MKNELTNMLKNLIMFFAWLVILTITTIIIVAVAQTWFDPVALIVIVPVVLMLLCTVWFGDGQY